MSAFCQVECSSVPTQPWLSQNSTVNTVYNKGGKSLQWNVRDWKHQISAWGPEPCLCYTKACKSLPETQSLQKLHPFNPKQNILWLSHGLKLQDQHFLAFHFQFPPNLNKSDAELLACIPASGKETCPLKLCEDIWGQLGWISFESSVLSRPTQILNFFF